MGHSFENKFRRRDAAIAGSVIREDHFCRQCDYNLRGLSFGGACPECGASILATSDPSDALRDVPVRAIKRLSAGLWILLASLLGVGMLPLMVQPSFRDGAMNWWTAMLAIAVVWALGSWLVTRPIDSELGILNGYGTRAVWRLFAGVVSILWVMLTLALLIIWSMEVRAAANAALAAAAANPGVIPPPAPAPVPVAPWAVVMVALAGIGSMWLPVLFLQRLAHWMYDLPSFQKLNWAAWGIVPAGIWITVTGGTWGPPVTGLVVLIIWSASIVVLGIALFALAKDVAWSARHVREGSERDVRRRLRREREARERAAAGAGAPPPPPTGEVTLAPGQGLVEDAPRVEESD